MKKLIVATSVALVMLTGSAFAKKDVQVQRTIWELSDFPKLEEGAKKACEGKAKLSAKLQAACVSHTFPRVTKNGAFYNQGIGAELNSLMRQETSSN